MRKHAALRRAIVEVIREERLKRGYSRRGLDKLLNQYPGYIGAIETMQHVVKAHELPVIAKALGIAASRLLVRAERKAAAATKG